jgi:hypothetical protein
MTSEGLPTTGFWTRLLRGGVRLTAFDRFLLKIVEQHVPAEMVAPLRKQWRGLNLIQRSPDWQELRFYRLVAGRADRADLPKLSVRDGEVKLLSVTLRPAGDADIVNVNFWAVDGWFFSLNADRPLRPFRSLSEATVEAVEHSYRSNLVRRGAEPH